MLAKRSAVVMGMVSACLLTFAPSVNAATWEGKLNQVHVNYESARWKDELYTQITWYGCDVNSSPTGTPNIFTAQIWEDITASPDESYDSKSFTACFQGERSNGEWGELPSGMKSYYFQIMEIRNNLLDSNWLTVDKYIQDTTKAD